MPCKPNRVKMCVCVFVRSVPSPWTPLDLTNTIKNAETNSFCEKKMIFSFLRFPTCCLSPSPGEGLGGHSKPTGLAALKGPKARLLHQSVLFLFVFPVCFVILVHLWQKTNWKNWFSIKTVFLTIQVEIGEVWRFPG